MMAYLLEVAASIMLAVSGVNIYMGNYQVSIVVAIYAVAILLVAARFNGGEAKTVYNNCSWIIAPPANEGNSAASEKELTPEQKALLTAIEEANVNASKKG